MFVRRKILTYFFKLTVDEKLREDIPNISTYHLIRGSMKLCFRLLFSLIINVLHRSGNPILYCMNFRDVCIFILPRLIIIPEGDARKKYDISEEINLNTSRKLMQ